MHHHIVHLKSFPDKCHMFLLLVLGRPNGVYVRVRITGLQGICRGTKPGISQECQSQTGSHTHTHTHTHNGCSLHAIAIIQIDWMAIRMDGWMKGQ